MDGQNQFQQQGVTQNSSGQQMYNNAQTQQMNTQGQPGQQMYNQRQMNRHAGSYNVNMQGQFGSQQSGSHNTNMQGNNTNNGMTFAQFANQYNANQQGKNSSKVKKAGSGCGTAFIIFIIILVVGMYFSDKDESDDSNLTSSVQTEVTTESADSDNSSPKEVDEDVFNEAKTTFEKGKYKYIKNKDLDKYCANLKGVKVYIVGKIDDFNDGNIQITLSDGFMMSTFKSDIDYSQYLKEGDTVAIYGTVSGYDHYKLTGTSVNLEKCKVFAVGEEAKSYKKKKTDSKLDKYLVVTDEVANNNSKDISKKEYKKLCKSLDYTDVLRNPDDYKDKYAKVSGTVDQLIEGILDTVTIYVVDSAGNKWECIYKYDKGESRLLEGDTITVYGKCQGTTTSKTLLGKQVTLVGIDAEYIK